MQRECHPGWRSQFDTAARKAAETSSDRRPFLRVREVHHEVPQYGTLYLAGPRSANVFLNGILIGQFSTNTDQPINFRVFHADVSKVLRAGENVLAVEAVRGRGVVSSSGSLSLRQLAYGEILVSGKYPNEVRGIAVARSKPW